MPELPRLAEPPGRRKLFVALLALCAVALMVHPAFAADCTTQFVTHLIDQLTLINAQSPGIDSAAIYDGFLADESSGTFQGGVLGVPAPRVPSAMRQLVQCGPSALPELIRHLNDSRPTKLEPGNADAPSAQRRVGVDFFAFSFFSDEYDPRIRPPFTEDVPRDAEKQVEKNFQHRYTVKVADVCFVLIGQIVNRHLLSVRYAPSAGLVVNSPIEAPVLAEEVAKDWGQGDAALVESSLLADIRQMDHAKRNGDAQYAARMTMNSAFQRLRLYFPNTYAELRGSDLAKRRQFEKAHRSSSQAQ